MNKRGFTLIELLVVIAIVGILSSVIYSNITGIRDRARITAGIRFDSSTLHSIGDQLVGEWLFDMPDNPLADTSGFGYNGTNYGSVYATTSGYNNKGAYDFNGTYGLSPSINTGNGPAANVTGELTVSAWIYPRSGPTTQGRMVVNTYDYTPTQYGWYLGAYWNWDSFDFTIFNSTGGGSAAGITNFYARNLNQWKFMVGVFEPGNSVKIYVDGKLIKSVSTTITSIGYSASHNVVIGKRSAHNQSNFDGLIDDVRIYSSALSGSDIQKLYAEGISSHSNLANK
ncbi:MAG: LamG-like jellyroll fold domain-containing protein [Candidatus Paceibacterota bacterium]|jgi:prepilin-type N-terminal cleavage/methylation domain-containing protein